MSLDETSSQHERGLRLRLRGSVQGVGFRPWLWRTARALELRGAVYNTEDGVEIEAFGSPRALDSLRRRLERPPQGAVVECVECDALTAPPPARFEIRESRRGAASPATGVPLAPDLPTCEACLDELRDPGARRYRHAFIACAECGPRYTLARELPYDRARTAMDEFPLCPTCAGEYARPHDRRFHAEATSCPDCGPKLRCVSANGEETARDEAALFRAVEVLRDGGVLAIHGIGGFHLACDASNQRAVELLRERKHRPGKALAVMAESLGAAEKLALLGSEERALLSDAARPIVLLQRRPDSILTESIAPGSPLVGLFLPYTPLHTLLLGDFGGPLVMTSANRSGEPIAYRFEDSFETLTALADLILAHDRQIVAPCDDSVVLPAVGGAILLRRSRGFVPRPIRLARRVRRPVLAYGGQWNDTICLAHGEHAWLSAHIGDLESPESAERLAETAEHMRRWLGVEPEVVACDLHPGYESTRLARAHGDARVIAVQHHHAHMAAVLAEHRSEGPALGLIWDGTGDGGDGSAWGGELLWGGPCEVKRLATFRPIALAGGERAIREPWRLALALLDDAFDGDPPLDRLPLFRDIEASELGAVRSLLAARNLCPPAHGVGRYFDAVGALLLVRQSVSFQGELALGLNLLCANAHAAPYPFSLDRDETPWNLDMRPALRELVAELIEGLAPSSISSRFHATLIAAGTVTIDHGIRFALDHAHAGSDRERPELVLGGGCFQNPLLLDGLERRLSGLGRVLRPRRVPPGDGGLSLGQAIAADAIASRSEEE